MAERTSTHRQDKGSSALAPSRFGSRKAVIPLLPYEHDLIRQLGCSEEEYRFFTDEIRAKAGRRPAAYDHIPDVRGEAVTWSIIISLVIGAATTAVSMLLAPQMPEEREGPSRRQRGGLTGPNRFNTTHGFDSVSDLAAYGDPIPIPFGLYVENGSFRSGGILCTPKLVWSRMFSHGTNQAFKCMYVVGETDMGYPSVNGTWLGTQPLDTLFPEQYALYWQTTPGSGRIHGGNLISGIRGEEGCADPWDGDEVFVAPTDGGEHSPSGFSMAFTPSNQTTFGVFNAVPNGTDFRLNYNVISIPSDAGGDGEDVMREERKKWTGDISRSINSWKTPKQEGKGCGYSRRMGLVGGEFSALSPPTHFGLDREIVEASVGDIAQFEISGSVMPPDFFDWNVTSEDITNATVQERIRADDLLQAGENFLIGKSLWRIVNRTPAVWVEGGSRTVVQLKCIDTMGDGSIGLTPQRWLDEHRLNEGHLLNYQNHAQINFFPLLNIQMGVVRNLRPAEVTEIGIKSTVWNRMNGLTNFKEVPTPNELETLDDDQVSLSVGAMNLYFQRYSFFAIQVRPSGTQFGGEEGGPGYDWIDLGEEFCIRGASPTAQYNYLRIHTPSGGQHEYRFVPRSCAYITRKPEGSKAWLLDAKRGGSMQKPLDTNYGRFTLMAVGQYIQIEDVEPSDLMYSKGSPGREATTVTETTPNSVELDSYDSDAKGRAHAYRFALPFGNPDNYENFEVKTIKRTFYDSTGAKSVRVEMKAEVANDSGNRDASAGETNPWGQLHTWTYPVVTVDAEHADTTHNWNNGDVAYSTVYISGGNPYSSTVGEGDLTASYKISVETTETHTPAIAGEEVREFEHDTQIAEISHYGDLISRSCDSGPEHEIVYVNETIETADSRIPQYEDCTTMGLAIRATRDFTAMDQPRLWVRRGIRVEKLIDSDLNTVASGGLHQSSNNFAELIYAILTNKKWGIGEYVQPELVDRDAFVGTARFLAQNNLAFDGVIEDRQNIREYVTRLAPMFLCNFTIRAGRFALVPALPVNSAGEFSNTAVPIQAMFSEGNIIQDSFQLSFIELADRENTQSVVQYRNSGPFELPEVQSLVVSWAGQPEGIVQNIDMTTYCTTRTHASMAARYMMSIRKRVDHTITFQTSPEGLALGPGDYIKVVTSANPYHPSQNGVILASDLTIISALSLADGAYPVTYYQPGAEQVEEGTLNVVAGKATNDDLAGAVFTVRSDSVESHVYLVEQLTLNEEMLVEISASYFPTDEEGHSLIAQDLLDPDRFTVLP